MNQAFSAEEVDKYMRRAAVSQSDVARAVGVSREAVSKWLSGESKPRPRHHLKLAAFLGMPWNDEATAGMEVGEPALAYVAGSRHESFIASDDAWLMRLNGHSTGRALRQRLPRLAAKPDTTHAHRSAREIRAAMGLDERDEIVEPQRILRWLAQYDIHVIPAHLGGEAKAIARPRTPTGGEIRWLYINLDATLGTIRLALLKEIAHLLLGERDMNGPEEETFAEEFAAAMMLPERQADDIAALLETAEEAVRHEVIHRFAVIRGIPPSVFDRNSPAAGVECAPVEQSSGDRDPSTNPRWSSEEHRLADVLFGGIRPEASEFIRRCEHYLSTPVFRAVAEALREKERSFAFVQRIFRCGVIDAMELNDRLREYGVEKYSP
jgi:transcriptional regulator with XRE-family HTH domain